jgi:hypothetical protein
MAEEEKKEEKKIIVDEDWKKEAQKEKEVVAAEEKSEEKEAPAPEEKSERGPLPKGDLAALISMLVTQAFYALGAIKFEGQEKEADLELARYNIDMLETLEEKTKGNLSENEEKVLGTTLNEVRMVYVKVSEQPS